MALRNKIFLACESLLRVPPLLVMDEIFRSNFGLNFDKLSAKDDGIILGGKSDLSQISSLPKTALNADISSLSFLKVRDVFSSLVGNMIGQATVNESLLSNTPIKNEEVVNWDAHYVNVGLGEWDVTYSNVSEVLNLVKFLVFLLLFAASLVVFVLSTKNLVKLYSYVFAFSSIYISYYFTPIPIGEISWSRTVLTAIFVNVVIRAILALIYFLTRSLPGGYPKEDSESSFLTTVFKLLDGVMLSVFFLSGIVRVHEGIYVSVVLLLQASLWSLVPKLYKFLILSWKDTRRMQNELGIGHIIQVESGRLRVNAVFRVFWISRALYDSFYQLPDQSIPHVLRHVMTNGSETLLGIFGLTVTVSAVAHQIGAALLWILYHGTNSETDTNRFGSISTVLFFILCLQTGLTSLDPDKRLDRLFKNVVLLVTALLHALHEMVAPLLHAFRSFQALQIRAVVLSVLFLTAAFWSSVVILRSSIVSTWSLAVLALAFEFKIKIVVSLLISIFVYFSQLVQTPDLFQKIGQHLHQVLPDCVIRVFAHIHDRVGHDDIIFYLKSFSRCAEFITAIFLFVNAIWIFLFESASVIRAIGMGIHVYFNIWCEGKKGWRVYCQRRTASRKIESLADANEEQLAQRRDDVCAICYEEMESAKVTLCGHLFHAVCLRKWLYVQNTCPLCHEILYSEEVVDAAQDIHDDDIVEANVAAGFDAQGVLGRPLLDNNRNRVLVPIAPDEPEAVEDEGNVEGRVRALMNDNSDSDLEDDWVDVDSQYDRLLERSLLDIVSSTRRGLNASPLEEATTLSVLNRRLVNSGQEQLRHRIQLNPTDSTDETENSGTEQQDVEF